MVLSATLRKLVAMIFQEFIPIVSSIVSKYIDCQHFIFSSIWQMKVAKEFP